MAEKKIESFIMYCNWEASFDELPKEDQAELIMAIFAYINRDETPNFPRGSGVSLAFRHMKDTIDSNRQKYEEKCETNRQNAKKSHKRTVANGNERKRTVANGSEATSSLAKQSVRYPNDNDNETDNDYDNEYEYEYETDNDNDSEGDSLLTKSQRADLVRLSSVSSVETYISKILDWQSKNGKKCKDVYSTIRKWIEQDKSKAQYSEDTGKSYDMDEYEKFAMNYKFPEFPD